MAKVLLFTALILSIVVPFRLYFKGERTKKRYKVSLAVNAIAFFGLMLGTGLVMFGGQASAADAANTGSGSYRSSGRHGYRSGLSGGRPFHRSFLRGRRYCRSQCGQRSARRHQ